MTASARHSAISRLLLVAPIAAAALIVSLPAHAQAGTGQVGTTSDTRQGARKLPRLVSVSGVATRDVTPDMAIISVGVTTRAPNAADALTSNSAAAAKIIAAVRQAGVENRDVQTSNVSISQNFRNKRDGSSYTQEPDGFTATNSVSIRVRDLAKLGPLLTAAAGQGANSINSLTFDFSGRKKVADELQAEAVRNARDVAQRLVEAAGSKLGQLQNINAADAMPSPRYDGMKMMRASADAAAPVPVEAGEMTITSSVQAIWTIE